MLRSNKKGLPLVMHIKRKAFVPADGNGENAAYFLAALSSFSSLSAPTHSFAYAHHSMQDVPMGRAFRCPHFLHAISGSSLQISIFSPHFWHRMSSGFGERISALPGQPSLNMSLLYSRPQRTAMIYVIRFPSLSLDGLFNALGDLDLEVVGDDLPVYLHRDEQNDRLPLEPGRGVAVEREQGTDIVAVLLRGHEHILDRDHGLLDHAVGRHRLVRDRVV